MTWTELEKEDLSGMWLEVYDEAASETLATRGLIQYVEWIQDQPRFHLVKVSRFDPKIGAWILATGVQDIQPFAMSKHLIEKSGIPKMGAPMQIENGIIYFLSFPSHALYLFPKNRPLPDQPVRDQDQPVHTKAA